MNGLTMDRSGRTLEDYRDLHWELKVRVKELEAQIKVVKEMIDLYFEGCDCDTFDDKVREVRAALEPGGICGHGSG
jgi:hypothetical protein